jgi:hypothetical protein
MCINDVALRRRQGRRALPVFRKLAQNSIEEKGGNFVS